ncbi:MAG: ribulose-phosphate 3-epimerase, partial [Muribaculaceae bacterium]|nr:ribulose-phosphate 3-epimerase [Muribaculaceae bacterium]
TGIYERVDVSYIHIDSMDAHFGRNLTFGPDIVNAVKKETDIPVDIHLLVEHPLTVLHHLAVSEGDMVVIHAEGKEDIGECLEVIRGKGALAGLALNPKTDIRDVAAYLPKVGAVLLMLKDPGFAGGSIIPSMLEKVALTRCWLDQNGYQDIELEVDGSVSLERAMLLKEKGASIFVGGTSGIYISGKDIRETIPVFLESIR